MPTPEEVEGLREPLGKFVYGYLRDRHATEDVVQETFFKALRNLGRYRARSSLKTWVFSIARNLCLDHLRASGRTRLRLLGALENDPVPEPSTPDPARGLELDERRARVVRALTELNADARSLLILRVYDGLSYREIARRRGWAPTGVGTRLCRARQSLTKLLRENG